MKVPLKHAKEEGENFCIGIWEKDFGTMWVDGKDGKIKRKHLYEKNYKKEEDFKREKDTMAMEIYDEIRVKEVYELFKKSLG